MISWNPPFFDPLHLEAKLFPAFPLIEGEELKVFIAFHLRMIANDYETLPGKKERSCTQHEFKKFHIGVSYFLEAVRKFDAPSSHLFTESRSGCLRWLGEARLIAALTSTAQRSVMKLQPEQTMRKEGRTGGLMAVLSPSASSGRVDISDMGVVF